MRIFSRKKPAIAAVCIIGLALLAGCSREEDKGKSMVQVYREKGLPVRVTRVENQPFSSEYTFIATLGGVEESNAGAPIGGTIHRIHYRVGDVVKKDAVVVSFPADSPATQYNQARVAFELSRTTLKRIKNLYNAGGVSLQELDTVRTRYDVARANWDAARQSVHVRAPITGTITQISVRESDSVEEKTLLFTVARTDRLQAEVWINENDITHIRMGDRAIARWNNHTLKGRVTRINRTMNPMRQAFGVVAEFENPGEKVLCGVNAHIFIAGSAESGAIVLNREDIRFEKGIAFVFVVENGRASRREVKIGRKMGTRVEILSGLEPGETIVTDGLMLVEDNTLLHVIDTAVPAAPVQ